ncbi:hypothetical protein BGZ80_009836 [Entomortierella chlamydospora]|uniref:Catalase n=1 Tax=Entomortierella chlamydospora TaxID=101097 RepID=A0A9P6T0B8_9FUNG|nr:hypothetical protein BGZ80_009836 [Entomortierella chlamydospora]
MAQDAPSSLATLQTKILTTSNGDPVDDNQNSLTAGEFGPILLQDFHLIDKLTHFVRERIPERVVHARGAGAYGHFEVTADISDLTCAKFLQPGTKTPVFTRFSTVGGDRGTSDSLRDVRGFAVKYYTEDGNYDMVGINTPVFWIRDPIKFPDLNHSQKRHPRTNLRDHDTFWDFLSLTPESLHQVTVFFSNRGTPYSYRHMHGFATHTFRLVNAQGVSHYVNKTNQGIKNHTAEDAIKLDGTNPDSNTEDLYEAIDKGDFPSWSVCIQVMTEEEASNYRWNIFDDTKVWPFADYPLKKIGTLTLNRNPDNYFAEVEQSAFSPSFMVPGIDVSNDRVLQGRLFAYPDTQRYRLGPNFQQLPVNQSYRAKVSHHQRDGPGTYSDNFGAHPNYEPQSLDPNGPQQQLHDIRAKFVQTSLMGKTGRYPYRDSDDDYVQPRALYNLLKGKEQDDLIKNIVDHIKHVKNPEIIKRQIAVFSRADPEWGRRVEEGVKASGKKL